MTVTESNNLLISTGESNLKEISSDTDTLRDTVYKVSSIVPLAVCTTSDNKVLVGGVSSDYPKQRRKAAVILINQNGDRERVYEHDQHKKPIFTCPWRITTTSNGNIYVVDCLDEDRGRVIVLGQGGDIIDIYTGHTEINNIIQFKPEGVVTIPRDNVIVTDMNSQTLHILSNTGLLLAYYKTSDINIFYPFSLAFSLRGQLFIGCSSPIGSTSKVTIHDVFIEEYSSN